MTGSNWTAFRALLRREFDKYSRDLRMVTILPLLTAFLLYVSYRATTNGQMAGLDSGVEPVHLLAWEQQVFGSFGFFAAVVLGATTVAGERESGSITITGMVPIERRQLLLAKIAGRWLALSVILLVSFLLVGGVLALDVGFPDPVSFVAFFAVAGVYLLVGLALGAVASTLGDSAHLAVGGAILFVVSIQLFWTRLGGWLLDTPGLGPALSSLLGSDQALTVLVTRLSPVSAFSVASNWALDGPNSVRSYLDATGSSGEFARQSGLSQIDPNYPWLYSEPASVVVLLAYGLLAFWLARKILDRGDL